MPSVLSHLAISASDLAHPTLFRRPWDGSEWLFELKHDGFRALIHKRGRDVAATSRNGRPLLPAFPEIALALLDLNVDGVFDGELVVPDKFGKPDWHELRRRSRMTRRESILAAAQQSPAVLCVFDVLVGGTRDMRERWQFKRKEWLRKHLPEVGPVRWLGHVHQHGTELFQQTVDPDLEGMVAKRVEAPYRAGRHEHWVKIKKPELLASGGARVALKPEQCAVVRRRASLRRCFRSPSAFDHELSLVDAAYQTASDGQEPVAATGGMRTIDP